MLAVSQTSMMIHRNEVFAVQVSPVSKRRVCQLSLKDNVEANSRYKPKIPWHSPAPFISYDPEFTAILGPNPTLKLVAQREVPFADEAGVRVSDQNEVGSQAAPSTTRVTQWF